MNGARGTIGQHLTKPLGRRARSGGYAAMRSQSGSAGSGHA
jgi:hypothetical protein